MRTAPAVWELEGPTMTGPRMSKMSSIASSPPAQGAEAFRRKPRQSCCWSIIPYPAGQEALAPVSARMAVAMRLLSATIEGKATRAIAAERSVPMPAAHDPELQTVVTCDDADSVLSQVDLYCEDGVIRAMGPDLPQAADTVLDGGRCMALSRSCEHPPPPLPGLFPEPAPGAEPGALRLAHRAVRDLEGPGPRRCIRLSLPHRHGRADEARLHHLL